MVNSWIGVLFSLDTGDKRNDLAYGYVDMGRISGRRKSRRRRFSRKE